MTRSPLERAATAWAKTFNAPRPYGVEGVARIVKAEDALRVAVARHLAKEERAKKHTHRFSAGAEGPAKCKCGVIVGMGVPER